MQHRHSTRPMPAAAVSPESPWNLRQFRMSRPPSKIRKCLLKRLARAVARITPHLAIRRLWLLVGRSKQSAVMLPRQRLPMQIKRPGLTRLARSFPATVLMHHNPTQSLHARRYPNRVLHRKDQFTRRGRSLIPHPMIRLLHRRRVVVGRRLCTDGNRADKNRENGSSHC